MLIIAVQAVFRPENIEKLEVTPAVAYRTLRTMIIEGLFTENGRKLA